MTNSRKDFGAYTAHYPRAIIEQVRQAFLSGKRYIDIAAQVKHDHKLPRFTKNNVAGMINRMRKRGELPPAERMGGKRTPTVPSMAKV